MKLIGISSSASNTQQFLNTAYVRAFTRPGIAPVVLPILSIDNRELMTQARFEAQYKDHIDSYVDSLSGLCLSGGTDCNPTSFGYPNHASMKCDSERDMTEIALIKAFISAGKPILGICRGLQMLTLDRFLPMSKKGFTYFQDLTSTGELHDGAEHEFKDRQEPVHNVWVLGELSAYLSEKMGEHIGQMTVTSFHHQGLVFERDGKCLRHPKGQFAAALQERLEVIEEETNLKVLMCTKCVIEAVEHVGFKFVGFQSHVEEARSEGRLVQYWLDRYVL